MRGTLSGFLLDPPMVYIPIADPPSFYFPPCPFPNFLRLPLQRDYSKACCYCYFSCHLSRICKSISAFALITCLAACLSVCMSFYLPICQSICLPVYLFVCLSVCPAYRSFLN